MMMSANGNAIGAHLFSFLSFMLRQLAKLFLLSIK
jgi:hypothetical protein